MVEKHITLHFSNLDPICNFILQSHRFLSLSSFFSHRAGLRGLLPTYFPSYTLPHSYYFHETNFELDQLPDLAQQLKQAVRSGDNRVYKNKILHSHQRWNYGFIYQQILNHLIIPAHAAASEFIPHSAAPSLQWQIPSILNTDSLLLPFIFSLLSNHQSKKHLLPDQNDL